MRFYELLKEVDVNTVVSMFLKKYGKISTKRKRKLKARNKVKKVIDELLNTEVNVSDELVLCLEDFYDEFFDKTYIDVYGFDEKTNTKYSILVNPWNETLGYPVDDDSLKKYGAEKFVVNVLWEMTFFGFTNDTVQKEAAKC